MIIIWLKLPSYQTSKESTEYLPPPQYNSTIAKTQNDTVIVPSTPQFFPRLAASVATSIVKAIKNAPTRVNKPVNTMIPPNNSPPLAKKAINNGTGKCRSLPNQRSKKSRSSRDENIS